MIDFSIAKLLLLAVIALLVLGPEKLPGAARTAGAMVRRLRASWDSVRAEVERELQVEEIKRAARESASHAESMRATTSDTLQQMRAVMTGTVARDKSAVKTTAVEPPAANAEKSGDAD